MAVLNDIETAKSALRQTWQDLAVEVEQARKLQAEVAESPSRLSDPAVSADVRWLNVFDSELADVRTVASSLDVGARLSVEDIRVANDTGRKLLEILQNGRDLAADRARAGTAAAVA